MVKGYASITIGLAIKIIKFPDGLIMLMHAGMHLAIGSVTAANARGSYWQ